MNTTTRTIRKTSSTRNVDAYRVGNTLRFGGELVVIMTSQRHLDDQGDYEYMMTVRTADAAERKAARIAELRHELSVLSSPPDDDRDIPARAIERDRVENELRSLEGRPTVEAERAAAVAEAESEIPQLVATARAQLDVARDAKVADEDGDMVDARNWRAIVRAIYRTRGQSMSPRDAGKMTDAELRALLS